MINLKKNKYRNKKKPDILARIFVIFFGAVIFLALYGTESNRRNGLYRTHFKSNKRKKDIFFACKTGNLTLLKRFLNHKCNLNAVNKDGETPLFVAMYYKHRAVAEMIAKYKQNFKIVNKNGKSLLHLAARYNYIGIVKKCLINGADVNKALKANLWTPLHFAARNGNSEAVLLLLEANADTKKRLGYGWTAYDISKQLYPDIAAIIRLYIVGKILPGDCLTLNKQLRKSYFEFVSGIDGNKTYKKLSESKFERIFYSNENFNYLKLFKISLLQLALLFKDNNSANIIARNSGLFTKDYFENSILHWAVFAQNEWLVKNLLQNGAEVNNKNIRGDTPLHIAVKINNFNIIKLLLNNNADLMISNNKGQNAYEIANKYCDSKTREMLFRFAEKVNDKPKYTKPKAEVEFNN